jgi:hypothetical protein
MKTHAKAQRRANGFEAHAAVRRPQKGFDNAGLAA